MSQHADMGNGKSNGSSSPSTYFDLHKMKHIVKPLDRHQKISSDVLQTIGNTPLVKLNKIPKEEGVVCDVYAKCEYFNPGGSVKDRIAYRMIIDAEERGILKPGKSVIIEPTSGNTGIGLSLAAAVKGYRCIIVLPEKMSDEKVNTMLALGSEIIRTPTEAPTVSPESNLSVARRLEKEIPGGVVLDQYNNPCNPLAHYDGTAEEILWSLDDDVDMIVLGAGTSGTVSGVSHKVKERCPKCKIVGVDPYGSILAEPPEINDSNVTFYEVEGLGYDFLPAVLDRKVVDTWVKTDDSESLNMARRLIREEGLLAGGSSGSALVGALKVAKSLKAGQKCVVLLPDSIRNYMTKFISDPWMEARNFTPLIKHDKLWWWEHKVTEELAHAAPTISHRSSMMDALAALRRVHAELLVVVDDKASVISIITANHVRQRLANMAGSMSDPLDKFFIKKFYTVDLADSPPLGLVSRMLDISPYVVLVKTEHATGLKNPFGVITSEDILLYIAKENHSHNGK